MKALSVAEATRFLERFLPNAFPYQREIAVGWLTGHTITHVIHDRKGKTQTAAAIRRIQQCRNKLILRSGLDPTSSVRMIEA